MTSNGAVLARIVMRHSDLGDDTYHQWITLGDRVNADRLGRLNAKVDHPRWTRWICNNTSCAGTAFVSDGGVVSLIEEAESGL